MESTLSGKRIAILAADGVERVELVEPRRAVEAAGARVDLLSLKPGRIQSVEGDIHPVDELPVDRTVGEVRAEDYDGVLLPGGAVNPDHLRQDQAAVGFVGDAVRAGIPVAAICHGPWTLVEADVVRGRRLTSYPSIRTDIRNAGGEWTDSEVVVDQGLITSRGPQDLEAFCGKAVEEFAEGRHEPAAARRPGAEPAPH